MRLAAFHRRAARIPPFVGVPLRLQLDLRLVAWTALATLEGPDGHAAALEDLELTARAVLALTRDGQGVAHAALSALPTACEGRASLLELKATCAPVVERFDDLVARARWDRLYHVLTVDKGKAHSGGAAPARHTCTAAKGTAAPSAQAR